MSRSALPRRRRPIAALALLAAAGVLAACSTTAPSAGGSAGGVPLNGIDASTVKIGYTVVDPGQLRASLGFKSVETGDAATLSRIVQAYVDYVNANGGFGGRQGVADIQTYVSGTASAEQSQALCSAFTQDSRVFAAVLDGQYENNVLPCYRTANTLMLDETLVAHDQTQFEEYSPYLWSPTHPEYSSFVKAQLAAMNAEGFFTGSTGVQVMPIDNEVARRVATTVVQPYLTSIGVTKSQIDYIDSTNNGTLGATSSAAVAAGKSGGFDRVIAIGGARVLPVALADFGASTYISTWGVSSWDSPNFLENNPNTVVTERFQQAKGLGYIPALDVEPERGGPFPDPARPQEGLCKSILDNAGIVIGEGLRTNYRNAFPFCDATFFLKAALDKAPTGGGLTAEQFKQGVDQIGTGYSSSLTFGSAVVPGQYAPTNAGRVLVYDTVCSCFTYKGENVPINVS